MHASLDFSIAFNALLSPFNLNYVLQSIFDNQNGSMKHSLNILAHRKLCVCVCERERDIVCMTSHEFCN